MSDYGVAEISFYHSKQVLFSSITKGHTGQVIANGSFAFCLSCREP
jgi:hypothetical protein